VVAPDFDTVAALAAWAAATVLAMAAAGYRRESPRAHAVVY